MIEDKIVMVGGEEMKIHHLPATKALVLLGKLTKIVGGLGAGMSDIPTSVEDIEKYTHAGNMLMGILDKIDPSTAQILIKSALIDSLAQPNMIDKSDADFNTWYDTRFSGKLDELFILLTAIFIHNYGNPMDWVGKLGGLIEAIGLRKPPDQSEEETQAKPDTQES